MNETGYKKTCRIIGAHNLSKEDRQTEDYYATDPMAIKLLMEIENLNKNVWECACGEGHLAKPLIKAGYNVKATDLIDRGYGIGGIDFLKQTECFDGDIVTNPPYKHAEDFIIKGLSLIPENHKLCLFMKLQFLEGKKRKKLFEKYPPKKIWVSSSRIKHGINGDFSRSNSMMATAWYIWEKGYTGDTVIKWFN